MASFAVGVVFDWLHVAVCATDMTIIASKRLTIGRIGFPHKLRIEMFLVIENHPAPIHPIALGLTFFLVEFRDQSGSVSGTDVVLASTLQRELRMTAFELAYFRKEA